MKKDDKKKKKKRQYSRSFRILTFSTYIPIYILVTMIIFWLLGVILKVGWLQSSPDVMLIPLLIFYYISLAMGAIYGFLKGEEPVYLMALISIGVWVFGFILEALVSVSETMMMAINLLLLAILFVLHIMQYRYTKNWETRLEKAHR
jgi:hypothetical protein